MEKYLYILLLASTMTWAQGSKTAISLDGVDDFISLSSTASNVTATSLGLPSTAITLEAWVYPKTTGFFEGIISFIQDNGAFEHGIYLGVASGNRFTFGLAGGGVGLTYLTTANNFNINQWHHVAATYDGITLSLYVNGILEEISTAQMGDISYADSQFSIGRYVDDNESYYMDGLVDEVRIWNTARTENEIRSTMSQSLIGTEVGLTHYWKFDDNLGTIITAQTGMIDGILTNADAAMAWQVSGAAIGDESIFMYPVSWTGAILGLPSLDYGDVLISNILGSPLGIQLYRVDSPPNSVVGINPLMVSTNAYFGVFVVNGTTPSYVVSYDYSNFPQALNNEPELSLYVRDDNSDLIWMDSRSPAEVINHQIQVTRFDNRSEFIIANIAIVFKDGFE